MKMKYDTSTDLGKVEVMQEFLRTKIPPLCKGIHDNRYCPLLTPPFWQWNDLDYNYPAEPEPPKLVPWTFETCPKGVVLLQHNGTSGFDLVATWLPDGLVKASGYSKLKWSELLNYYTHSLDNGRTWLPCGTEEKR